MIDPSMREWFGCKRCGAVAVATDAHVEDWWRREGDVVHDGCGGELVMFEIDALCTSEQAQAFLGEFLVLKRQREAVWN